MQTTADELYLARERAKGFKQRLKKALKSGKATMKQIRHLEEGYNKRRSEYEALKRQVTGIDNF